MKCRFEEMFEMQQKLQSRLDVKFNQEYINIMIIAAISELVETIHETPWKPWKKKQKFNRRKYLVELADVIHFFINLCLAANINCQEIFEAYMNKNLANHVRQNNDY